MTGPSVRSAKVVKVGEAKKVCFVVSPMGEQDNLEQMHADWLVSEIIEPVIREIPGFVIKRADHHRRASPIDTQVMHYLLNSDLVIAVLSSMNAYVFYDIAIRHISRKPIIHMHREGERLPFDPNLCESIGFSRLKPSDLRTARSHLRQLVDAVLDEGYEVINPISHFFGGSQVTPISGGFAQKARARPHVPVMPQTLEPVRPAVEAETATAHEASGSNAVEAFRETPIPQKTPSDETSTSQDRPVSRAKSDSDRGEASQPAPHEDRPEAPHAVDPREGGGAHPMLIESAAQPIVAFTPGAAKVSVQPLPPRPTLQPSAVAPAPTAITPPPSPRASDLKLSDPSMAGRLHQGRVEYKSDPSRPEAAHNTPSETPNSAPAGKPINVSPEGLEAIKARLEARLEEMQTWREAEPG
jgi:hypothetical protein